MSVMDGKVLSAATVGKIVRRAKKERSIALPAVYTIVDDNNRHVTTGTFRAVAVLCPKVNSSTLKRRLDNGDRVLSVLRKAPTKSGGRRKART